MGSAASMHVALCTPISLKLLEHRLEHDGALPDGFRFPVAAFLVDELLKCGCEVTVVTSAYDCPRRMEWRGPRLRVIATPRRRPRLHCLDAYRREVRAMRQELAQAQPDIIHAQWTYEFADAALGTGIPCLVTARDAPWLIARHFRQFYRVYRAAYSSAWIVPRIRHLVCGSPHILRHYQREPGFRGDTCLIPNGLDERLFASGPKTAVRQAAQPVFQAVTEWNRLKNVPCLLRAFALVRRRMPGARLILLGRGMKAGEIAQTWAGPRGLCDGVAFQGERPYRDVLAAWQGSADIAVHTTREESFSMVVLEAMANGTPVVGGLHSGAVPWLLDDGQAGLLANIEDPADVARQMLRLAEDPVLYRDMSARAWTRARQAFTLQGAVKQYLAAYARVLGRHEPL